METRLGIFLSSFIIGLSGAMMPGPVLVATIHGVARRGFVAAPLIVLGHGVLEVALIFGIVKGLDSVLANPAASALIGIFGGVALLWMAGEMMLSVRTATLDVKADTKKGALPSHPVFTGMLTSAVNPYWVLWWATIGLKYVGMSMKLGTSGLACFYGGHILADLGWYGLVAAGLVLGRKLMTDRAYGVLIALCAAALIWFGAYFAWDGARKLWHGGPDQRKPAFAFLDLRRITPLLMSSYEGAGLLLRKSSIEGSSAKRAVDFLPMADPNDLYDKGIGIQRIDDSIVSNANAVCMFAAMQFPASGRVRVFGEFSHCFYNPGNNGPFEFSQLLPRRLFPLDSI